MDNSPFKPKSKPSSISQRSCHRKLRSSEHKWANAPVATLSVRQKRHTAVTRKSAQKAERIRGVICAMCGIAWQLACSLPLQKSYGV
jgi:hypothetical protein